MFVIPNGVRNRLNLVLCRFLGVRDSRFRENDKVLSAVLFEILFYVSFLQKIERKCWEKKAKCWYKSVDEYFFNSNQIHKKAHKKIGNNYDEYFSLITCFPCFLSFYFFVAFVDFFDFNFNIFHKKSPIKKVKYSLWDSWSLLHKRFHPNSFDSIFLEFEDSFCQNILSLSDSTRVVKRYFLTRY